MSIVPNASVPSDCEIVNCENLTARLDTARENGVNLVVISGESGLGKTVAVEEWVSQQENLAWPEPSSTIRHDFKFRTGFIGSAKQGLRWKKRFSDSPWERGKQIAKSLSKRNGLAVLDSLQAIQFDLDGGERSRIVDPAVDHFVQQFSRLGKGMCILVSERPYPIPTDVNGIYLEVEAPDAEYLAEAMSDAGVEGHSTELQYIAECVGRNPAVVNIFTRLALTRFDGDVDAAQRFVEPTDAAAIQTNVGLLLTDCVDGLAKTGDDQLLHCLSVIPGPISLDRLAHFRTAAPIEFFTASMPQLTDEQWHDLGDALISLGLVKKLDDRRDRSFLEIETVAREHLCQRVCSMWPGEARKLCNEMFHFLQDCKTSHAERRRDLYDAINFGCLAGQQQTALNDTYLQRLSGGSITYFRAEHTYDEWTAMRLLLTETDNNEGGGLDDRSRGIAEHTLAHCYRMVGKYRDASDLIEVALKRFCEGEHWADAQRASNHLAVCYFMQARLADSLTAAIASIEFARLISHRKHKTRNRSTVGKIFLLAGRIKESEIAFALAKGQREKLIEFPASRFADLLLETNRLKPAFELLEELENDRKRNKLAEGGLAVKRTYVEFLALPNSQRLNLPENIDEQIGNLRGFGLQEESLWGMFMKAKMIRQLAKPEISQADQCLDEALPTGDGEQAIQLRMDVLMERCHLRRLEGDASGLASQLDTLKNLVEASEQTFCPDDSPLAPWIVGTASELIPPGTKLRYDRHQQEIQKLSQAK